jgi:hypothetical protein
VSDEGKAKAVLTTETEWQRTHADLSTACDLLKRAADTIIKYEQEIESGWPGAESETEADVLPAIGAFLTRVRLERQWMGEARALIARIARIDGGPGGEGTG